MSARNERARAAQFLAQIAKSPNRTIDWYLSNKHLTAFESELLHGVLRHYFMLSQRVNVLLEKPLREKDLDVFHLMLVGAYQLDKLRIPAHAAVDESVQAVMSLRKPWAKGLINAVMRKLANREPIVATEQSFEAPQWLGESVFEQFSNGLEILNSLTQRPPMCLRVNSMKGTPEQYTAKLDADCQPLWHPETLLLHAPVPQLHLPGYAEGLVSVQDAAGQWAAHLLDVPLGGTFLDACAAPGGKLFHVLEQHPSARATAVEISERRATVLDEQALRLGHNQRFTLHIGDATSQSWWDGALFDAILLDAPCTGTGTLRRNPDIKLHRSHEDIAQLTSLQSQLLANLWPMLKAGGSLLYCTCSILRQENDDIIELFLKDADDAQLVPLHLPTGQPTRHGWQLLPTDLRTDGFYYAKLVKAQPENHGP